MSSVLDRMLRLFFSGIRDRPGHFNDDVNGKDPKGTIRAELQNYMAAFNLGVYVTSLLPKIAGWPR